MPRRELSILGAMVAVFLLFFYLPVGSLRLENAVMESLYLGRDYARQHVLLCLVPAFFIAGGIASFVKQDAVMRYLGPTAHRAMAYGVASVSGTILAVCSCTVLPLFAGIHRRGAGLGPAIAFLYSGPAINVLAIILTARVLGMKLGLARAVGAIVFSVVIGLIMHLLFQRDEEERAAGLKLVTEDDGRRGWQTALWFASMVAVLVFANWGRPSGEGGAWAWIYVHRFTVTGVFLLVTAFTLWRWFHREELRAWVVETWAFVKQIMPLLLAGVLVAGLLLGRPGHEGIVPAHWVQSAVGGEGVVSVLFAAVAGALMYFATLTEIPILQGLLHSGMGQGPALALLLAGPAVSLPNLLVIRSVLGTRKTLTYASLVVVLSTGVGWFYGNFLN